MSGWMNLRTIFEKVDPFMHVRPGLNHSHSLLKLSVYAVVKSLSVPIMQQIQREEDNTESSFSNSKCLCSQLLIFLNCNMPKNVIKMVLTDLIKQISDDSQTTPVMPTNTLTYMLILMSMLFGRICICCETLTKLCSELGYAETFLLTLLLRRTDPRGFCLKEKCTDIMLKVVLLAYPMMNKLNLNGAPVTNYNFHLLIYLKCLTELQIARTDIDASSLINAMGAHPVSQSLESFTCSHIKTPDLMRLLQSCPKLKHIGLDGYIRSNHFHTTEKYNIKRLTLTKCNYLQIRDVIERLGPTLEVLDMQHVYNVPLMDIVIMCPHLQMLNMCMLRNTSDAISIADDSLFENIEYLSLNIGDNMNFISHAISCCKNLKGLTLYDRKKNAFDSVLENCTLTNLEQISMCSISSFTALCLLRHCPKLRVVAGLDLEAVTPTFLAEAKAINPGVIFYGPIPNYLMVKLYLF